MIALERRKLEHLLQLSRLPDDLGQIAVDPLPG
jgi:hypothetical protein